MRSADSLEPQSPAEASGQPAAANAAPAAPPETTANDPVPPSRWKPQARSQLTNFIAIALIVVAVVAILYAWQLPPFGGRYEQTDNAYVRGQTTIISPQVAGYVADVPVQDFQNVKAGDVLVRIEDRIYSAKVAQARANVLSQAASFNNSTQAQRSR